MCAIVSIISAVGANIIAFSKNIDITYQMLCLIGISIGFNIFVEQVIEAAVQIFLIKFVGTESDSSLVANCLRCFINKDLLSNQ